MDEQSNDQPAPVKPPELGAEVAAKEARKLRARRAQDRTVWFGLGVFGLVGWSVAVPTVLGVALGIWLDMNYPGRISWALALLLAGATLGAWNAWYWVTREQQAMDREREDEASA